MFRIEYIMFDKPLVEDIQDTKAETLDEAETMAIIGCCLRLDLANACIKHINNLQYDVLLENAVIGRIMITSICDIAVEKAMPLFEG